MPVRTRLFLAAMDIAGFTAIAFVVHSWVPEFPIRLGFYLILALLGARMNVMFPGVRSSLSVNYIINMLGLIELQVPEALLVAMVGAAAKTYWHEKSRGKTLNIEYLLFNVSQISVALLSAAWIFGRPWFLNWPVGELVRLTLGGMAYFVVSTIPLSIAIALTDSTDIITVWKGLCNWLALYYLVGVSVAEIAHIATERLGWTFTLALLPLLYVVYRSVRIYFAQLEQEKEHAQKMASLHLRTIEALAMAIEAKDECTGEHLRRVQVYSLELAKYLGLSDDEVHALQAASILHDIGKLAVPDYIISKPGKLTPEEFDKMKIHTIVGADILEQVAFPYPVAPIVRSHHEKWDGSGYPDGIKGEEIPIGARILSAVDCLDALASDRQYRRALPLNEAMNYVASMAGKHFDPAVVELLQKHYHEFEIVVQNTPLNDSKLKKDVVVSRGDAPDAGYEKNAAPAARAAENGKSAPASISQALEDMQAAADVTRDLGHLLRPQEILAVLLQRLKEVVPFDGIAVYARQGDTLVPAHVNGENSRLFASLRIPVGQGLSGWVVETGKPIVNGNPSVEPGYLNDSSKFSVLSAALSIPLRDATEQITGALTLYRAEKDSYNSDHLRIVLALGNRIGQAVEAVTRHQANDGRHVDQLTRLPDGQAFEMCLKNELTRRASSGKRLAVLACGLDGFRRINDSLGVPAGDDFLKRVAVILQTHCRSSDYVARIDGDRFGVLLADAPAGELAERIESLDRMVRAASRETTGEDYVGLSIGVACFPENAADAPGLLAFAERELARVKRERKATGSVLQLVRSLEQEQMPVPATVESR